jgi:hypothetical protein
VHTVLAVLVIGGLSSAQGEFRFGVPQFQQLYHPVLICLAAAAALVAARLILGRGHALLVAVLAFLADYPTVGKGIHGLGYVHARPTALYVTSAVAIELAALVVGTDHRLRFALVSAAGVATVGLAGEWALNSHAIQPWHRSLFPAAFLLGLLVALGAAPLGAAFAAAVQRRPSGLATPVLAVSAAAVIIALAVPLPRRTGHVIAAIHLDRQGDRAVVTAVLDPPAAADHDRWFQVLSWQGGGLVVANMRRTAPGRWISTEAVPVSGSWKTLLRLQRGNQLMAVPIWLPADAAIPAPAIEAVDRTAAFLSEPRYLLREQTGRRDWFALVVYLLVGVIAAGWATSLVAAGIGMRRRPPLRATGSAALVAGR